MLTVQLFPTDVSAFRRRLWVFRWGIGWLAVASLGMHGCILASLERTTTNFFYCCCSSRVDMHPTRVPVIGNASGSAVLSSFLCDSLVLYYLVICLCVRQNLHF